MTPTEIQRAFVLIVVMAGGAMALLDIAVVNVALPSIMVAVGANVVEVRWVVTAFMLCSALVMPLTGWMGRRIGYGNLYIVSLAIVTAGSALCAVSWDLNSLVLARIVQGIGAGTLQATGMALITHTFPAHLRGRAIGIWGISLTFGPALGPATGGGLIEEYRWRAVFMINVPIGIAAILFSLAVLDRGRDADPPKFDWLGYLAIVAFMSSLLLTLDQGNELGWKSDIIRFGLFFTVLSLVVTVLVEWKYADALVPLRLFRLRDFTMSMLVSLIRSAGMFASFFLQPLFLQQVQRRNPINTGLILMPAALSFGVGMPIAGWLTDRFGGRWPTVVGAMLAAISYGLYFDLDYRTDAFGIIFPQMIRGIGMALIMSPAMTVGLNAVSYEDVGHASWMLNIGQRFGGSMTVAVLANLLHVGSMVEQDRLGTISALQNSPSPILEQWAIDLGHAPQAIDTVMRSVYQWDVRQAATIISYENIFVGVGLTLLLVIPPALFMSSRRPARD